MNTFVRNTGLGCNKVTVEIIADGINMDVRGNAREGAENDMTVFAGMKSGVSADMNVIANGNVTDQDAEIIDSYIIS